ncbi:putative syndecan [Dirofilaria immitis]
MELNSLLFISCYVILLQNYALCNRILEKREISSLSNIAKHNEVEGSGIPPLLSDKGKNEVGAGADIEWDGSGVSPDDEDGDIIEGSGAHIDEDDSSYVVPVTNITPRYSLNTTTTTTTISTTTTTQYSSFDIHELGVEPDDDDDDDDDNDDDEEDDVAIEEEVEEDERTVTVASITTVQTWTTTSRRPLTPPPLITQQTSPPTIFDEKHNIPFDSLLKPGILAALIGGIVIGILVSILLIMFVVYRMRKKDEGSYALDEPKQPPHYSYAYQKAPTKEFYA